MLTEDEIHKIVMERHPKTESELNCLQERRILEALRAAYKQRLREQGEAGIRKTAA